MSERLSLEQLEEAENDARWLIDASCPDDPGRLGAQTIRALLAEVRRLSAENQQLLALFKKWNLTADA